MPLARLASIVCACALCATAARPASADSIRALEGMQPMPVPASGGTSAPTGPSPNAGPTSTSTSISTASPTTSVTIAEGDSSGEAKADAQPTGRSTLSIGAHVGVWNELSPTDVFGGLVFLETAGDSGKRTDGALRVSVSRTLAKTVDFGAGSGKFTWTKGALDLCPVILRLTADFSLRPCATVAAGIVQAQGVDGPAPHSSTRPWVGAGALARAYWSLGGPVRIEAQAGATFTLWRDSFGFGAVDTYAADSWVPFGSVGLAIAL